MVSSGDRHRIVVYPIESPVFREDASLLRYADFIIGPETTHYWVYGMSKPGTSHPQDDLSEFTGPHEDSPKSIGLRALAIVRSIADQSKEATSPMEVGTFLEGSRGQTSYTYASSSRGPVNDDMASGPAVCMRGPITLIDGGEYSKRTLGDGTIVWAAKKVLNPDRVVTVTIKPATHLEQQDSSSLFDPNGLGRGEFVPECRRVYWAFDRTFTEVSRSLDIPTDNAAFYEKVDLYLRQHSLPPDLRGALDWLRFKAAVASNEADRIRSSAQAYADDLSRDNSLDAYACFMELGVVAEEVEKSGAIQSGQWLRPFVRQMVKAVRVDDIAMPDKFARSIEANKWFDYGRLLFEELRDERVVREADAAALLTRIETSRLAATTQRGNLPEPSGSVALYWAHLDGSPLQGDLDMNDLRSVLNKGFLQAYPDRDPDDAREAVENILRLVRIIAGDGPFCGDEAKLLESIQRFCRLYRVMGNAAIPIDTVLATFLALSFYDTSLPEDHDRLFSQFHDECIEVKTKVSRILSDRAIESLVTPDDLDRILILYEERFRSYVDDPLWPMFKFPLTQNEESRLAAKMTQSLSELARVLDPLSIKVQYGGATAELKKSAIYEISSAVQQILPAAAFLRRPAYPGVACQYRGAYGFTAWIDEPFYEEGNRAKEKFKAMKYFHLGHRLQDVVEEERRLWVPPVPASGLQKK
jgi:hypothetical protein